MSLPMPFREIRVILCRVQIGAVRYGAGVRHKWYALVMPFGAFGETGVVTG